MPLTGAAVEASYGAAPVASTKIVADAGGPTQFLTTRTVERLRWFRTVQSTLARTFSPWRVNDTTVAGSWLVKIVDPSETHVTECGV